MHRPLRYYARPPTRNRRALSMRTGATATRARAAGAIAAVTVLTLLVAPVAANALETSTYPVALTVRISDGADSAALAGVNITVRTTDGDDAIVGTGITGSDGTVALDIEGRETNYVADAEWPGAPGDLEQTSTRTEFHLGSGAPVDISLRGTYGTISGAITAIAEGQSLADLSGAALLLASGASAVQRIVIAADGSFVSGTLPTSSAADYSVSFIPPAGYDLAAGQPTANPHFELPRGTARPSTVAIARQFTVVPHDAAPTPTPTPPPTPTPTATPAPPATPTATPTPSPTPSPSPTTPTPAPRPAITVGTVGSLGAILDASTEDELIALLAATAAGDYQPTLLNNGLHQMLGIAQQPTPPQAQQLLTLVSRVTEGLPGLTTNDVSFATMDLEALLVTARNGRASALNSELSAKLAEVQERNAQIAKLNAALSAIDHYRSLSTEDAAINTAFTAASDAVKGAGIEHAFLTTSAQAGADAATALAEELRGQIDAMATSQQLDMLRTQSLLTNRSQIFETMSELIKKMADARSNIIGNMRSTPVSLGTMQWTGGTVTGSFDLSKVPNGEHHLILNFADAGIAVVASVTVQHGDIAEIGTPPTPAVGAGLGLLAFAFAVAVVIGAVLFRRRQANAHQ